MPSEVTVNLVKIVLPYKQNGVTIRMVSSTMLRLTTEFGVDLLWDRAMSLEIQLSSDYKNKVAYILPHILCRPYTLEIISFGKIRRDHWLNYGFVAKNRPTHDRVMCWTVSGQVYRVLLPAMSQRNLAFLLFHCCCIMNRLSAIRLFVKGGDWSPTLIGVRQGQGNSSGYRLTLYRPTDGCLLNYD